MTWSYSGDPSSSSRDAVRFYIQDVDVEDQVIQDEDIDFLLKSYPDPQQAAIKAVEILIAKFSQLADRTIGELSVSYAQKTNQLKDLVGMLKDGSTLAIRPVIGGNEGQPFIGTTKVLFRKGMMDYG